MVALLENQWPEGLSDNGKIARDLILHSPLSIAAAAIMERLREGFPSEIFGLELVPALMSPTELGRITRKTPCLLLGWSKTEPDRNAGRMAKGVGGWVLYLITRNESNPTARFLGDKFGPGLFGMIAAATALLHGFTVKNAGTIAIDGVASSYAEGWGDQSTAIASLDLSLDCNIDAMPPADAIGSAFKDLWLDIENEEENP